MDKKASEFSRVFDLTLPSTLKGYQKIVATEEESVHIAKRLGILSLKEFTSEFTLSANDTFDHFELEGKIHAELTQQCVVTMLPVDEVVDDSLHIKIKLGEEEELPDEYFHADMDDVEYVQDTRVDIGELVLQYLSLSINPYPRQDQVITLQGDEQDLKRKPFAKLEELKK